MEFARRAATRGVMAGEAQAHERPSQWQEPRRQVEMKRRRRWGCRACTMPRPLASPSIADRRRTDQRTEPPPSSLPGELPDEREHPHKLHRQEWESCLRRRVGSFPRLLVPSLPRRHVHVLGKCACFCAEGIGSPSPAKEGGLSCGGANNSKRM
eukprot:scaffold7422_cov134-Isochrysis_galbana.AAC.10